MIDQPPRQPKVGDIYDMIPTAEMRRERVTRTVQVVGIFQWRTDDPIIDVIPHGGKGRRSQIRQDQFLRRFVLRGGAS